MVITMKNFRIRGKNLTLSQLIFQILNYIFFTALCIMMVIPFWHIIMVSFSDSIATQSGGLFLIAKGFNTDTYASVLTNPMVHSGFLTSIIVTVIGTFCGTLFTAMASFALSKDRLRGGTVFLYLILFTMHFGGGMIPSYMLVRKLGLLDTRWALILPSLMNAYNIIIMMNFFKAIPESLEESARIDGASDARIFFQIILPLSKASLATIGLFVAVGYWNDYFSTVLYINRDTTKWSLQAVLRFLLTNTSEAMSRAGVSATSDINVTPATTRAASTVVTTIPILIVYPFVQKYFVQGVMIGGVKG